MRNLVYFIITIFAAYKPAAVKSRKFDNFNLGSNIQSYT